MSITARIRSALGWATADRREEARGKLQELDEDDGSSPFSRQVDEDALLDEAELHVRGDHGDLAEPAKPVGRPLRRPPEPG